MKHPKRDLERRIRLLNEARPDLADKDLTNSDNLDIDAFQRLFPPTPLPPGGAAELLKRRLAEEHAQVLKLLSDIGKEDRKRLLDSDSGFVLIDGTHLETLDKQALKS